MRLKNKLKSLSFTKAHKRSFAFILTLGMVVFFMTDCIATKNDLSPKQNVAIIQIIEHPALDATRQGILDELKNKPINIEFQSAQGNSALATQIAQKFVGARPTVMVGLGTTATQALIAANQQHLIPIVFSSVTDPKGAKIVKNLNMPEGVVTGVSNFVDPALQFDLFKKILPNLLKIGVIYNPGEANSVTLVEEMEKIAAHKGLQLILATANTSADIVQATQKLIPKVQAIFINNDNTALSAFDSIINISTKHKIPVFCSDLDMVDHGALAALGADQYEIGKQTGKLILNILNGENPNQIPVVFPKQTKIRFNAEQASKLGIKLPK
jgi:putative ABC transport system substrate-binding protein